MLFFFTFGGKYLILISKILKLDGVVYDPGYIQ